ncbi:MAG TPA: uracil-DNA glycosylase [Chloroflexaceae bacterium]|nr:uracil-DNA glycosylase [Chloroflexaceae bacterium]
MHEIEALIADLAALPAPPDAVNMYAADGSPGNTIRRANLALALRLARERGPDLLLVGEAPGYNGARRTGVPFTSERLLLAGLSPLGQFGAGRGFRLATDDGRTSSEQTATIAYRELSTLGLFAAGWNAYPLHPHRPGADQSNRPPRAGELALGRPLLARFLALFPGVPVVAMGNVAAAALAALDKDYVKLRHPAQGGARIFAEGLRAFAQRRHGGQGAV